MTLLAAWQNFYVIAGSAAGALIGLQFVAMSLIARAPGQSVAAVGDAFASPTIVHFGAVLALSGLLAAPWEEVGSAAVLWGALGLGGVIYEAVVTRRMRRQAVYRPQFEDWLFHVVLPFVAYLLLAGSAAAAWSRPREALFAVAAAVAILLLCGIHNAWDAVTYHIFYKSKSS